VIWAIGASMVAMSLIARLPARWGLALGLAILLLYPFVVSATTGAHGVLGIVRMLTIAPGMIPGAPIRVRYAAIPWLAVMCLGFGLGSVYRLPQAERRRRLLPLAIGLLLLFLLLRSLDGYGDPAAWSIQATPLHTVLAFMNVSKYPPSPDYVFATLGISIMLFLMLEAVRGPVAKVLLAYGRTPLFTYVCHLYILHFLMVAAVLATGFPFSVATHAVYLSSVVSANWGFSLAVVYSVWLLTLALLTPLSLWFSGVKARRRDWWLSYL
jgi:uncharacterized membrane protein